jgi:hypothetical protein
MHGSKVGMRRCNQKRHYEKQVATRWRKVFGFSWNLLVACDSSCYLFSFSRLFKK